MGKRVFIFLLLIVFVTIGYSQAGDMRIDCYAAEPQGPALQYYIVISFDDYGVLKDYEKYWGSPGDSWICDKMDITKSADSYKAVYYKRQRESDDFTIAETDLFELLDDAINIKITEDSNTEIYRCQYDTDSGLYKFFQDNELISIYSISKNNTYYTIPSLNRLVNYGYKDGLFDKIEFSDRSGHWKVEKNDTGYTLATSDSDDAGINKYIITIYNNKYKQIQGEKSIMNILMFPGDEMNFVLPFLIGKG